MKIVHFIKNLKGLRPGIICVVLISVIGYLKAGIWCAVTIISGALLLYCMYLLLFALFTMSGVVSKDESDTTSP